MTTTRDLWTALAARTGLGASWRIGVDAARAGHRRHLRPRARSDPHAMVTAHASVALMVPTWVSAAAPAALVAAVHTAPALTGRVVPGVGRLPRGAGRPRVPA